MTTQPHSRRMHNDDQSVETSLHMQTIACKTQLVAGYVLLVGQAATQDCM
jgi:hypothetical protein